MEHPHPCPEIFAAILSGNISKFWDHPRASLNPFLPLICKAVSHSAPNNQDLSVTWVRYRKALHSLLLDVEAVNHVKKYLQLDFGEIKHDALREQQLLKKLHPGERPAVGESVLMSSMKEGAITEFEKGGKKRRFRVVLGEVLRVIHQMDTPFQLHQSDLFECVVFLEEIGHIVSIATREMPSFLSISTLTEALLRVNNGSYLICCVLANMPEAFSKVLKSLILNGESLDEISLAGRVRSQAIQDLVAMHPSQAPYVQWLAYSNQKLPTLMIFIALDNDANLLHENKGAEQREGRRGGGVLSLMSDIVIHGSDEMRAWFAQYMKLMQQKYRRHRESAVAALRKYLMKRLMHFVYYNHHQISIATTPAEDQPSEMEVELEVGVVGEIGEEEEEEKMDTLTMELVDQMEIEISETDQDEGMEEGPKSSKVETAGVVKPAVPQRESRPRHRRRHSSSFTVEHVAFTNISLSNQFNDNLIEELTQLLHVCCGLKVQVHMYLTNDEISAILRIITCTCPPFSSAGVIFIKVSLSVLLACPFLISSTEGEQATVRWLQWLLEYLPEFEKLCPGESCYGEMLLLVAMHLQDKQIDQIEKLIRSVLGMRIAGAPKSGHFSNLRTLFLKVFNESVVCSHAVSVTPTPSLNGSMTGYLPIHCVHQLIQSKAFRKSGVSVKEWIYRQMCCVSEPLHKILPSLIEEYVQAIVLPPSHASRSKGGGNVPAQTPFTAEEVLSVFRHGDETDSHTYSSQILMLYYVLYYQDCFLANLSKRPLESQQLTGFKTKQQGGFSLPSAYSPNVMLQLPVKKLLQYASMNQASFLTLYPSLLRLIVTHFPHLCLTEDWIKQEEMVQGAVFKPIIKVPSRKITVEYAEKVLLLLESSPSHSLLVLSHLTSLSPSALLPFCSTITSCLPLLLGESTSKHIQQLFSSLWTKLNSVVPRRLWVETVNALRPPHQRHHPLYTHQNLVEDPLIVLRCDTKVFRCPSVFGILLRVLASCTAASRVWLSEHAHIQNCATARSEESGHDMSPEEREELRIALTAAQESAIIQLLLEVCLPSKQDREESSVLGTQLTSLREIQCLVGSYLHQVFIAEPSMVKLVHFQGYPIQLLPMMVSGVPSMHIAMDFVSELLSQPQLDKQVFAIQLAATVTAQYPLSDAMGVARNIFKRLDRLVIEVPSVQQDKVFKPVLPAVVTFCETFPPLCTEATSFLLHLCKVCSSNLNFVVGIESSLNLPEKIDSTGQHVISNVQMKKISSQNKEPVISQDPVFGMEDKLEFLSSVSLVEGARWTFNQIVKEVVLKVSGKA